MLQPVLATLGFGRKPGGVAGDDKPFATLGYGEVYPTGGIPPAEIESVYDYYLSLMNFIGFK